MEAGVRFLNWLHIPICNPHNQILTFMFSFADNLVIEYKEISCPSAAVTDWKQCASLSTGPSLYE